MRTVCGLVVLSVLAGCGRGPFPEPALLYVQVVDADDNPLSHCDVELLDGERVRGHRRCGDDGTVVFPFPGVGSYRIHASNDPQCCFGDGATDVVITRPDELVVVEVALGPCPTWTPPYC